MPLVAPRMPVGERLRIAKTRSQTLVLPENETGRTNTNVATVAADPGAQSPDNR
jgi:hypothetical protein